MTARDRTMIGFVALLAVVAGYWFLLLAPQHEKGVKLDTRIAAQRRTLESSLSQIGEALAARRAYSRNYASVARLGEAVPADDNVPSLVFQLEAAAGAAHVDFRSMKLTGAPSTTTTAPTAPATGSSTSSSSSSSSSSTSTGASTASASAPATQAAAAILPPGATVGPAGFPTMPFSFSFEGSFFRMSGFLARLERFVEAGGRNIRVGGRLLTLDGFTLAASRNGFPHVKATLSATAYLVPAQEGVTGGATATAPGGASTVSSSSSASPAPAALVPASR